MYILCTNVMYYNVHTIGETKQEYISGWNFLEQVINISLLPEWTVFNNAIKLR